MLVTNAAKLMSSIKELLEAAEIDQLKMQNLQSDDGGKYTDRVRLIATFGICLILVNIANIYIYYS